MTTGPNLGDIESHEDSRITPEILARSEIVSETRVFNGDGFSRVGHGCDCLCGRCVKRYWGPTGQQDSEAKEADYEHTGRI